MTLINVFLLYFSKNALHWYYLYSLLPDILSVQIANIGMQDYILIDQENCQDMQKEKTLKLTNETWKNVF